MLAMVVIGEVAAASGNACHCGMSQCGGGSCCPKNNLPVNHAGFSCFCIGLLAVSGDLPTLSMWSSSPLILAGNNPVPELIFYAIFHPPKSSFLLSV
ncbi:MAG: hypothetical protein NTY36_13135 [Deltaproteobacteria bacterium]|nr:hypothetical protein [Deltaproteobacteria bacterium]